MFPAELFRAECHSNNSFVLEYIGAAPPSDIPWGIATGPPPPFGDLQVKFQHPLSPVFEKYYAIETGMNP